MNYYEPNLYYDSNYSGFDQFEPPKFPVIHQPIREKTCAELLAEERAANINTQPMQYPVIHQPPQEETSLEFLQDKRNLINSVQTFLRKFNRFSFYEMTKVVSLAWETISKIEHAFKDKQYQPEGILELFRKRHDDVQNIHEELAEYINTPNWNRPIVYYDDDDNEDYTIAITPVLSTKEPVNSLIMENEHLDTIPATESEELKKSSVENLVQIPSESEGIPNNICDVPFHDNSPPLDISKDQFEGFSDSNNDSTSIDDDSFSIDNIDYVEASPPDSKLVSLEVVEIVIPEIEALKDNPTPSSDFVTKSSSTSLNFFLEETNTFDNSLPESETFCFNLEEISSGSPTSYLDLSLPDYEAFFCDSESDSGNFTMDVVEDIFDNPTREPRVHVPNVLPTHPTLQLDSDFTLSSDSLGFDLVVSFPSGTRNKIFDPGIFIKFQSKRFLSPNEFSISFIHDPLSPVFDTLLLFLSKNEDNVFNLGILASNEEKSPHLLSHRGFKAFQLISESPMMIFGGNTPNLDVSYLHFYPLDHLKYRGSGQAK
ncbi:hypothetical protein Tco_0625039 [Tanacetum coccineum]|uniref:Uncharacterized protein n=1 Tax=Tanacetum coccineum TaxID=301880 RepID=A0ABQ4WFL9_9ASTR